MPFSRRPSRSPSSRSPAFEKDEATLFLDRPDGVSSGPGRSKRPKKRNGKPPAGKLASKRSSDFNEGRLYQRDLDDRAGHRDPPQPAEGNYADRGFGPMRIGYRS